MIEVLGPKVVASELEREVEAIRVGFSGYAYWVMTTKGTRRPPEPSRPHSRSSERQCLRRHHPTRFEKTGPSQPNRDQLSDAAMVRF